MEVATPLPTTVPELLRAAARQVRVLGYACGIRHTFDGRVCAIGAIESALNGTNAENSPLAVDAIVAMSRHITKGTAVRFDSSSHMVNVAAWSNSLEPWLGGEQHAAEALAVAFEAAAAHLEAGKGA